MTRRRGAVLPDGGRAAIDMLDNYESYYTDYDEYHFDLDDD